MILTALLLVRQVTPMAEVAKAMKQDMRTLNRARGSEHGSQSAERYEVTRLAMRAQLMEAYPAGCAPPKGYVEWFDWAEAQHLHGLRQKKCKHCALWLFPQEVSGAHNGGSGNE